MGSRGIASYSDPDRNPPTKKSMPTRFVREFRAQLTGALDTVSSTRLGIRIFADRYNSRRMDGTCASDNWV